MNVVIEEVISPHDQEVIVSHAREMVHRLDESPLTSPLRGGLLGAGIGILVACVTDKSPSSYGLWGGAIGASLAATHRSWFVAGWKCGFCKGVSADLYPPR